MIAWASAPEIGHIDPYRPERLQPTMFHVNRHRPTEDRSNEQAHADLRDTTAELRAELLLLSAEIILLQAEHAVVRESIADPL